MVAALQACATGPDAAKVAAACEALYDFANKDNSAALVADGALPALLAAQRAHAGHAGVNEYFCLALCYLARDNAANAAAIVALDGALPALLAAQRAHAGDAGVNGFFLWALCNITEAAGPQRAHTKAAVEACGALAVARALMQQFRADDEGIKANGRYLLEQFA